MLTVFANVAYSLMLVAFVTRDILYLRSLLVVAQTIVVVYTWRAGVPVISGWNTLYVGINAFMVVQILRERRAVVLPPDLRPLYERHFSALSPPEFLRWWGQGRREVIENTDLAREGERPAFLYFVLDGSVRVSRNAHTIRELSSGYFVGEMSLITGREANADVRAIAPVEVVRWSTADLAVIRERNPALWTKIQSAIGLDLVEKIRHGETNTEA